MKTKSSRIRVYARRAGAAVAVALAVAACVPGGVPVGSARVGVRPLAQWLRLEARHYVMFTDLPHQGVVRRQVLFLSISHPYREQPWLGSPGIYRVPSEPFGTGRFTVTAEWRHS